MTNKISRTDNKKKTIHKKSMQHKGDMEEQRILAAGITSVGNPFSVHFDSRTCVPSQQ
jgi:hypothetical protein